MKLQERSFKDKFDDTYIGYLNTRKHVKYLYEKYFKGKHTQLNKNIDLKHIHRNKRCFVIGNGLSINDQDLILLKNEIVFMVNRSFLDSRYEIIKPKYHVIIDPKLSTGEWPIVCLDEIANKNPDVTFILNSAWHDIEIFQDYKNKYNIYWVDLSMEINCFSLNKTIDLTKRSAGKFVVEQAIIVSAYMGAKSIYITGVDGDGFAHLILNQNSHSYGKNVEDVIQFQSWSGVRNSICSACRWLLSWYYLDIYIKNNNSEVINISGKGIMNMVKVDDFNKVVMGVHEN